MNDMGKNAHRAKCYECGKYFDTDQDGWYSVFKHHGIHDWRLCSPSCLVTFAWEQKESQEKLSKSGLDEPDPWAGPNWVGKRADE